MFKYLNITVKTVYYLSFSNIPTFPLQYFLEFKLLFGVFALNSVSC